jgi:hypothetical protein
LMQPLLLDHRPSSWCEGSAPGEQEVNQSFNTNCNKWHSTLTAMSDRNRERVCVCRCVYVFFFFWILFEVATFADTHTKFARTAQAPALLDRKRKGNMVPTRSSVL